MNFRRSRRQVLLIGSALIFALVMGLLALALAGRRRSPPAHEAVWVWGLGLAFPLLILAPLTVYGLVVGERVLVRGAKVVIVRAEARQWDWTFAYPDAPGLRTQGILHIPAAQVVEVEITSADVVHSFWVPRLAGKLNAVPGHVNRLRLQADHPGDYAGQSAEFSGRGYLDHRFAVRAHDPAGWAAFLAGAP